jgi:RNA-directed DNA polymerase
VIIVRYADDFIVGFEHEGDARCFLDAMRGRLQEYALSLHPNKTCLIEFGRHAAANRERRGLGKPETFQFLGFTFICGKCRAGHILIHRKPRRDRMRAELQEIKKGLRLRMHGQFPNRENGWGRLSPAISTIWPCQPASVRSRVPSPSDDPLDAHAPAPQPKGLHDLGSGSAPRRGMAPASPYPPSLARAVLRPSSPEAGAVCLNRARTVLCEGCSAMSVPTASFLFASAA